MGNRAQQQANTAHVPLPSVYNASCLLFLFSGKQQQRGPWSPGMGVPRLLGACHQAQRGRPLSSSQRSDHRSLSHNCGLVLRITGCLLVQAGQVGIFGHTW